MPNGGKNDPSNPYVSPAAPPAMSGPPFAGRNRSKELIDPEDPQAARRFELQNRGGAMSDRIKIDPYKRGTAGMTRKPMTKT